MGDGTIRGSVWKRDVVMRTQHSALIIP